MERIGPSWDSGGNQRKVEREITHSSDITELILLTSENLAQNTAHDLAATGLGQIRNDVDSLGGREGTDALAHLQDEFLAEGVVRLVTVLDGYKCVDSLAGKLISNTHDGRLGNRVMLDKRGLDLGSGQAVARHVDDIVDTATDPVEALVVATGTVSGELERGQHRELRPRE